MSDEQTEKSRVIRKVVGRVVSNKMDKSVTVSVERLVRHAAYGKYIRRSSKILAHDEANACNPGDMVAIAECRPLSKHKAWRVVEVLETATSLEAQG